MTNAEKFKEVFGFELNTKTDYYCPFNSTKCDNLPCDACIEKFWQSEYKEPKEERINIAERIKLVNNAVEKTTAEWKQAINDIKAEIEAKNTSIEDFADTHGWVNGLTNEHNAHEADLAIIDKHTKELMK